MKHFPTHKAYCLLGFFLIAASGCSVLASRPELSEKPAEAPFIKISSANFALLKWHRSGGFAGLKTQMTIRKSVIQLHRGAPDNKKLSQTKALSKAELQAVFTVLNHAKFTQIVGKYNTTGMMDGFSDVVTLVLKTPGKKPISYVVDSYGDAAPKAFHDVTETLRALQNQKFTDEKN